MRCGGARRPRSRCCTWPSRPARAGQAPPQSDRVRNTNSCGAIMSPGGLAHLYCSIASRGAVEDAQPRQDRHLPDAAVADQRLGLHDARHALLQRLARHFRLHLGGAGHADVAAGALRGGLERVDHQPDGRRRLAQRGHRQRPREARRLDHLGPAVGLDEAAAQRADAALVAGHHVGDARLRGQRLHALGVVRTGHHGLPHHRMGRAGRGRNVHGDRQVLAAHLFPVADLAGMDLAQLRQRQPGDGIGGVDEEHDLIGAQVVQPQRRGVDLAAGQFGGGQGQFERPREQGQVGAVLGQVDQAAPGRAAGDLQRGAAGFLDPVAVQRDVGVDQRSRAGQLHGFRLCRRGGRRQQAQWPRQHGSAFSWTRSRNEHRPCGEGRSHLG